MIAYEDASAALEWLAKAFGFRERTRITMPDGSIGHAEMEIGDDGIIMLAEPDPHYQGPKRHAETCEATRHWSAVPYIIGGVFVHVDDVDAHFKQAEEWGRDHPVRAGGHRPWPQLPGRRSRRAPLDVRPAAARRCASPGVAIGQGPDPTGGWVTPECRTG